MYSINFPDMFNSTNTILLKDHEATSSNLVLLLYSVKKSLFGDPYFGTNLRNYLFEQSNLILRDIVIDDIYTAIKVFMPQISLKREDISVELDGVDVKAKINCINLIDHKNNLFIINLTSGE